MKTREEELHDQIFGLTHDIMTHQSHLRHLKKEYIDEETKLIQANLKLDKLQEELRVLVARKTKVEPTEREKEIAEFKERMPAVMKRLEGEKLRE